MQHIHPRKGYLVSLALSLLLGLGGCGDDIETVFPAPILPGGGFNPPPVIPAPQRIFLENSQVKVGVDLNAGGAITYLADALTGVNMVNNYDLGRQLQTSLYSGPVPFEETGNRPIPQWIGLGWNPVQTGDMYNNPSQVLAYRKDSTNRLYVKTAPLIWPLRNRPAECVMEHWLELRGNVIRVRSRTQLARPDTTQYQARTQEAPCMHLNAPYYRVLTYTGDKPFTNDGLFEFNAPHAITERYATENWAALVDKNGWGVGIYRRNEFRFISGFFGATGVGGERDDDTGYLTAIPFQVMDHNGVFEFEYDLIVGSVDRIRQYVYSQPRPDTGPNFRFTTDRQGWHYYNTRDSGWPIRNELSVQWGRNDPTLPSFAIKSPKGFWRAADVRRIVLEAAFTTSAKTARLNWRKPGDQEFEVLRSGGVDFPIIGDGQFRTYTIDLSRAPGWEGIIYQIQLEATPGEAPSANERSGRLRLRSVSQ
ncbi:hypothetical protein F5984_06155 [Rudanella paleaurantiibacter]|uniref:Uncharacterized protein n=1 Tax=Rudanella paleaurantiibacter TaxID=2614655 RepID=A0A7J5U295_9BACT|nr:hypothetical protein [Rudanella paleaurantiibacter]KAB7731806.1 hypothetical protein F5984_06155 [Rudanella paleaurantiibacter]